MFEPSKWFKREEKRERGRETDRQTDRHTERETEREREIERLIRDIESEHENTYKYYISEANPKSVWSPRMSVVVRKSTLKQTFLQHHCVFV